MKEIYLMIPLLKIQSKQGMVRQIIIQEIQIERIIKLPRNQFTIHEIDQDIMAVQVDQFQLSYNQLNQIFQDKNDMESKIKLLESTLENFQVSACESSLHPVNLENLIRKAKKSKQLKQENKKLRKLLQIQLENTEKVRQQTQKTMKTLKQQFDALVNEMNRNSHKSSSIPPDNPNHHHRS